MWKTLWTRNRWIFSGLVLGAACLLAWLSTQFGGVVSDGIRTLSAEMLVVIRGAPWPLFYLALALLPMLGVPIVPLYLAAGAVHGLGFAMVGVFFALIINFSLSYLVSRKLHGSVEKLVTKTGWKLPRYPEGKAAEFTLLVRLTPGAPLMVQNYILGLLHVPFMLYLSVSLATEMLIATGYIVTGQSLYQGQWGFLWLGLGLVVFAILLTRVLRGILSNKTLSEIVEESEKS